MEDKYRTSDIKNYLTEGSIELEVFYEDLKKGVKERHTSENNKPTERQFLSPLYKSTFSEKSNRTVVLDIEIWNCGKKCDLLLYNNQLQKIMFVEAKMDYNDEIKSRTTPEVIEQLNEYTSWLIDEENFIEQYSNYINFINEVFDTSLNEKIKSICRPAKLLVFEDEGKLRKHHKEKLIDYLGEHNVMFATAGDDIDKIWEHLDR